MAGRIRTGTRQAPQRYRLTPTRHRPDAILLVNAARAAVGAEPCRNEAPRVANAEPRRYSVRCRSIRSEPTRQYEKCGLARDSAIRSTATISVPRVVASLFMIRNSSANSMRETNAHNAVSLVHHHGGQPGVERHNEKCHVDSCISFPAILETPRSESLLVTGSIDLFFSKLGRHREKRAVVHL